MATIHNIHIQINMNDAYTNVHRFCFTEIDTRTESVKIGSDIETHMQIIGSQTHQPTNYQPLENVIHV